MIKLLRRPRLLNLVFLIKLKEFITRSPQKLKVGLSVSFKTTRNPLI